MSFSRNSLDSSPELKTLSAERDLSDPLVQQLIEKQTPLVEKLARTLARRLPASVDCDDLIQDGLLGLIDAILRWTRETTTGHFQNYVALRAHGAMMDGLRAIDPGTRRVRKEMRRVENAIHMLGHQYGRPPLESEVAAALGMPLKEYRRILQEAHGYSLISLEDLGSDDYGLAYLNQCAINHTDPLVVLERTTLRKSLAQAIAALSEQSRQVLQMYYVDDLKMHEIGALLNVSEVRVSQIHAHIIAQLRATVLDGEEISVLLKPRAKPRAALPPMKKPKATATRLQAS